MQFSSNFHKTKQKRLGEINSIKQNHFWITGCKRGKNSRKPNLTVIGWLDNTLFVLIGWSELRVLAHIKIIVRQYMSISENANANYFRKLFIDS